MITITDWRVVCQNCGYSDGIYLKLGEALCKARAIAACSKCACRSAFPPPTKNEEPEKT